MGITLRGGGWNVERGRGSCRGLGQFNRLKKVIEATDAGVVEYLKVGRASSAPFGRRPKGRGFQPFGR